MTVSLILMTMNEITGCKLIIPRIDKSLFNELICIDGGSIDGTIEYLEKEGFKVIVQDKKYNENQIDFKQTKMSDAYMMGVNAAKSEYIVHPFTPDNNMIPEKLPELIQKAKEGYDYVCVSRYKDNAKSYDDNLITAFGNWMFTTLVNVLFGGKFTDVLGGFKCVKKDLYEKFNINNETARISVHTQLAIGCLRNNIPYADIPGDEPERVGGKSSINPFINGMSEVKTITKAFFNRSLYKIK
jgi:glycosyltransferase involved in cell wall biosynthesis